MSDVSIVNANAQLQSIPKHYVDIQPHAVAVQEYRSLVVQHSSDCGLLLDERSSCTTLYV